MTAATVTTALSNSPSFAKPSVGDAGKLAILGGSPVRAKVWPQWPAMLADEKMMNSITKTTKSGIWSRIQSPTGTVATFEKEYARLMGTDFCIGTGLGTQALATCVEAMNIGPGDEVITSPYTDFGTVSALHTNWTPRLSKRRLTEIPKPLFLST